ncbi:MAG: 23S rRNA (guanosine(2251)-2'-O)-methyltransferase RlmB [Candidatus Dormibacteria bacterium]
MDILYGKNPVLEALRSGRPARKLVVAGGVREEPRLREIRSRAQAGGIPIEETPRRRLDDITHTEHHQGVAGYFHSRPALRLDTLLARSPAPQLLLVLDEIQDPQNFGALVRSAEAIGVDGIITTRHRAAGVTPAAAKASAGATEHMDIVAVTNLVQALEEMAATGLWRVGLDVAAGTRYDGFDYTVPVAVVVGAEGDGLRALTKRHCDALVSLPMAGHVATLNAAVAGAVLLFEVARQRNFAPRPRPSR